MPDIHFECPKCKQMLDAPEELAAQLIECPTCKETIEVPLRSLRPKIEPPPPLPPKPPEVKAPEPPVSPPQPVTIKSQPISVTLQSQPIHVVVKDFEMEFGSMVVFMIKWGFAAIPAVLIVGFCVFIILTMLGVLSR